ncbi:MAG: twin-arginine translocase TatA/TatE family subunit [Armatimonadetes bacterium CG_4_10_14_3_um_filter_66_18]|nr:twin-arginine translocase TatA/TatE family subunit [Armatimonadota bacterium]OIP01967.1 MAG: Sec-independent protein translocase TatA [Armatimonadetes bacterium CG2_30_66_41]PIU94479.1 MAG: twin-arginine translocase TatA/TatE family subunit [Armatimonadetes bacterium CG06_land_8_20_14_3_00_66_21]PIX45633.1 MAG: twin-arginine translocase TatA/TatE family subunit [Armatimonadetes bacterium CG_4_8_14_3_um_filter_66_20]PIY35590.1 MAG: twin-arginine translocase TatA/TatE family subunit [Armatimon
MFGPTELIVILLIVLLFFGATKVPQLARSLGQGMREFREGAKSAEAEETLREESA